MLHSEPESTREILCLEMHDTCFSPSFFQGIKVIISVRGTYDCVMNGQRIRGVSGMLLNRNIDHAVLAPDATVLIYYINYQSPLAATLQLQLANQNWLDISERVEALSIPSWYMTGSTGWPTQDSSDLAANILIMLFPDMEQADTLQDRTLKLIRFVNEHVHQSLSLTDVADLLSLSVERARHVFEEEIRMPFSQYVLWMRFQCRSE